MKEITLVVLMVLAVFLGFVSISSVSQIVMFGAPLSGGTVWSPNMDSVKPVSGKFLISPTRTTTFQNKSSTEISEETTRALAMVVSEFGSPLTVSSAVVPFAISNVGVDPYRDAPLAAVRTSRSVFFFSSMHVPVFRWVYKESFRISGIGSSFVYHGYSFYVADVSGSKWLFRVNNAYFAVFEGFPSYFCDPDAKIYIRMTLRNGVVHLALHGG